MRAIGIKPWNRVKIKTLTPIHVGSGIMLQNNTDYVTFNDGESKMIGIIDDRKLLEYIGEENVQKWVLSIERGDDTKTLVRQLVPGRNIPVENYSKRIVEDFSRGASATLKECIHDGMGHPYIPGSSIKGAIRTSVLASLMQNKDIKRFAPNLSGVENNLFGKNPQESVFRFLHVGDAIFDKECEIACRLINLNIKPSTNSLRDERMAQLVEAISEDMECEFKMKIELDYNQELVNQTAHTEGAKRATIMSLPSVMQDIETLFSIINAHTIKLLQEELDFWSEREETGQEKYLEQIKIIKREACRCQTGKECVMRLGHTSGWRFITGAWTEQLDNFDDLIPPKARPGNSQHYSEFPFPKSRRLDEAGYILGFVKMTIGD